MLKNLVILYMDTQSRHVLSIITFIVAFLIGYLLAQPKICTKQRFMHFKEAAG